MPMSGSMIASFIVRFTRETDERDRRDGVAWRGVIRHVQSKEQVRFVRIEDALAFMARYVDGIEAEIAVEAEEPAP